jgi:toxin YoeB
MTLQLAWTTQAWDDYLFWQTTEKKIVKKINALLAECRKDPLKGTGKPEALTGDLQGFYSRRINLEHRLVYSFNTTQIIVQQCRYHY